MKRVHASALVALPLVFAGCDKEPSRMDQIVDASTVPSSKPSSQPTGAETSAPAPAGPVSILVESGRFAVAGSSFDATSATAAQDAATAAAQACMKIATCAKDGAPDVDAKRNAKPSQVATLVAALHAAGAKSATIKTQGRDNVVAPIAVTFATLPVADCTTVAFIGKDGGIGVWHAGGGTAKKYSRGFAGPDMTLGTEAVRNATAHCESALLLVGADDAMIWGLVHDLVAIARVTPDGGTPLRATQVGVVQSTTPAGRKITADDWK
jgi:hypothetical protein